MHVGHPSMCMVYLISVLIINVEVEGNVKTKTKILNLLMILAFPSTSMFTLKSSRPYTYLGGQHACTSDIGILVEFVQGLVTV